MIVDLFITPPLTIPGSSTLPDVKSRQGYSATFKKFNRQIAIDLVEKYNIRNKKIN